MLTIWWDIEVLITDSLSILNQGHDYFQSADYVEFIIQGQKA